MSALSIDTALVRRLLAAQFPEWANLPIRPVMPGGWDNRTFRLGEHSPFVCRADPPMLPR